MIERGEGARHHGDVHHVPEVPHVGPGVEHKPLVQNLQISLQISANILWLDPGPWSIVASLQEMREEGKACSGVRYICSRVRKEVVYLQ